VKVNEHQYSVFYSKWIAGRYAVQIRKKDEEQQNG